MTNSIQEQRFLCLNRLSTRATNYLGVVASVLVGVLGVCGNVYPHAGSSMATQLHGWPLTYIAHESYVDSISMAYYGPWPFYSPPLVWFSWPRLVFNVLFVVVTAFLSYKVVGQLTGKTPMRMQWSLFSFLTTVTVASVLLGVSSAYWELYWLQYIFRWANISVIFLLLVAFLGSRKVIGRMSPVQDSEGTSGEK